MIYEQFMDILFIFPLINLLELCHEQMCSEIEQRRREETSKKKIIENCIIIMYIMYACLTFDIPILYDYYFFFSFLLFAAYV